ncbi:MAG: dTMP kinase [Simkaniaceae bacterium]|nr:dTMP kinase [Simkaniaceae bacterium]
MKSQNLNKGWLITFEGGEGSGKTTLQKAIHQSLIEDGYPVTSTKEPGGSRLGEHIRELLLYKTEVAISNKAKLLLYLADRAQHIEEVIAPKLKEREIILCDRFTDSTLAYQGDVGNISEESLENLCSFAASNIIPDLTFFLNIDPKIGLSRIHNNHQIFDRMESETLAFHENVRKKFLSLAKKNSKRFVILDANLDPMQVKKLALKALYSRLNRT